LARRGTSATEFGPAQAPLSRRAYPTPRQRPRRLSKVARSGTQRYTPSFRRLEVKRHELHDDDRAKAGTLASDRQDGWRTAPSGVHAAATRDPVGMELLATTGEAQR
jgi:hypothetical protein